MKLRNTQAIFKDNILSGTAITPGFKDRLVENHITAEERLSVYKNNIIESLTQILRETYPLTEKLVGEEFMLMLAKDFIKDHMPAKANMNLYGAAFPVFIKTYRLAEALPYLSDVAAMEWLQHEAYHASDDEALDISKLNDITEDEANALTLHLRSSVKLIRSDYPLLRIKEYCSATEQKETLDINQGGECLLIYRPQLTVTFLELSYYEYLFLKFIQKKQTISEAGATLLHEHPNVNLTALLQRQLQHGIFTDVCTKEYSHESRPR